MTQGSDKPPGKTWAELMAPMIRRFELGAALGHDVVHGPDAAKALASLINSMATKLDKAAGLLREEETRFAKLLDAAENLVIGLQSGWELDGFIQEVIDAAPKTSCLRGETT